AGIVLPVTSDWRKPTPKSWPRHEDHEDLQVDPDRKSPLPMNLRWHVAKYWGRTTLDRCRGRAGRLDARCRGRAGRLDAPEYASGSAARTGSAPLELRRAARKPMKLNAPATVTAIQLAQNGISTPFKVTDHPITILINCRRAIRAKMAAASVQNVLIVIVGLRLHSGTCS